MTDTTPPASTIVCVDCGRVVAEDESTPLRAFRPSLAEFVRATLAPRVLAEDDEVCRTCAIRLRTAHLLHDLEAERGQLGEIERDVAAKAAEHDTIARHLDESFLATATVGQRAADVVARVGGSWPFVIGFLVFLVVWMFVNVVLLTRSPFDPFPFILLNLVLSCVAALQAPIIMMSQNRAAARDRLQADQDYRVNLKAEIEIAALHEKVDHLLHAQWENLIEMQQAQLDLLRELADRERR